MVTIFFGKETSGILKSKYTLLGVVFVQSVKVQNGIMLDFEVYYVKNKDYYGSKNPPKGVPISVHQTLPRLKKYF
jgi:hypothetical protein